MRRYGVPRDSGPDGLCGGRPDQSGTLGDTAAVAARNACSVSDLGFQLPVHQSRCLRTAPALCRAGPGGKRRHRPAADLAPHSVTAASRSEGLGTQRGGRDRRRRCPLHLVRLRRAARLINPGWDLEFGLVMSTVQLLVACAALALVAPVLGAPTPALDSLSWQVIASVAILGALGTGIAFVLHLRNIRLVGATTASMVTYIIPIFATVIGAAVLSERVTWFQPVGAVIVLLGVAVAQGVRF